MENQNLSMEVEFLQRDLPNIDEKVFGKLSENKELAFQPETTGVAMQVEGLISRNIVSKRDINILQESQNRDRFPNVPTDPDYESEITRESEDRAYVNLGENAEGFLSEGTAAAIRDMTLRPEVIIGATSEILPIWFLEAGATRARAICKIETSGIDYLGRSGSWRGTGFLISENILLTNHHVLNSPNVADNAISIFNYQVDETGKMQPTQTFQLNPSRLFLTSAVNDMDFTFCWVDGQPGKTFGYFPIHRHSFIAKKGDCANIIQHPNGEPKSVVVQKNEITNQDEIVIRYTSDTLPGSSGGAVANNEWKLFALHHASREVAPADLQSNTPAQYMNEGIKLSAIATYLETISNPNDKSAATEVLKIFNGTDAMLGYFGSLGRVESVNSELTGLESVVDAYKGEARDVDIAFWNIEWFNKNYATKLDPVAKIIVRMNMDVWSMEESSPQAAKALVEYLNARYQLDYGFAASEPNAPNARQTTTIIWNKNTVHIEPLEWPENIKKWFRLTSNGISNADELVLEASNDLLLESVDGKIFDRFPGLFKLTTVNREEKFDAFVVPLHLKAKGEGSKRRILASRILAVAVQTMIDKHGVDKDWILGGDMNATLASGDLNFLNDGKLVAISAEDENNQAITYVKKPFKSFIDHIFLSPNLAKTTDSSDFFVVAQDKVLPDYLSISDHRPILVRLSLQNSEDIIEDSEIINEPSTDPDLINNLSRLRNRPSPATPSDRVNVPDDSTREDAISSLRANRNREYYNAEQDARDLQAYYGTIPTNLNPQQLFTHFSQLITQTHKNKLSYKPATYLYPWVDLQPDKTSLRNVYSGEMTPAEELIEADFAVENMRLERFQDKYPTLSFESSGNFSEDLLLERLESDFPFNCEHVVPQSWFSKANPMKGDLHHLFACTPRCNSFRSNTPYFEFPNWEERTMDECGLSESKGFEPKEGKGTVARATLYFLLRYPKVISQYSQEQLISLITWHVNERPTIYEKHRNAAIQELQGNRNPLIDHPQLAVKIDFTKGLK